jgi:hypothetical protein
MLVKEIALDVLHKRAVLLVWIPALLAYFVNAARAKARRDGPPFFAVLLLPRQVLVMDRAIGHDLLFAAIAEQLGFLGAYGVLEGPAVEINTKVEQLFGFSVRQVDLGFIIIGIVVAAIIVLSYTTRWLGHRLDQQHQSYDLKEGFATIPNVAGFFIMLAIYYLNPVPPLEG